METGKNRFETANIRIIMKRMRIEMMGQIKVTNFYYPSNKGGLTWNDPEIGTK